METIFWVATGIIACFGLGAWLGAPFLPVFRRDMEVALDLAGLKAGQTLIDLGSGDGRMLVAAARRGANAIGYEVNPLMYLWSKAVTWPYRRNVTIYLKDYWRVELPPADVIYMFLINRFTAKLDVKLKSELKKPTTVVSYVFALPRKPVKQTRNTFLYIYP